MDPAPVSDSIGPTLFPKLHAPSAGEGLRTLVLTPINKGPGHAETVELQPGRVAITLSCNGTGGAKIILGAEGLMNGVTCDGAAETADVPLHKAVSVQPQIVTDPDNEWVLRIEQ